MTYEEVLTHFSVASRRGTRAQVKCPCHDDQKESLTITRGENKTLMYCHAGCGTFNILEKVGLKKEDLFYEDSRKSTDWKTYVETREKKKIEGIYNYVSFNGAYNYTKLRLEGKKIIYGTLKNDRFTYGLKGKKKTDFQALYGDIKAVKKAILEGEPIFIPEGEKDTDTLNSRGFMAITYGGANDWKSSFSELFKDAKVYVLADNDKAGIEVTDNIQTDLKNIASYVKVIVPTPDIPKGDITDYFAVQKHSNEDFKRLLEEKHIEIAVKAKPCEKPDLIQFHHLGNNGLPTSVFDLRILEYIKQNYDLFICGGTPYVYFNGVYQADSSGTKLKTMIKSFMLPEFVKSNIVTRIFNLFLQDADLEKSFEDLNNYPNHWICFINGMYDCKTKKLLPNSPKYYCINQIPHAYDPNTKHTGAKTDSFLDFACENKENEEMLLQFIGYCLTQDTSQQKFLVLNGIGGSGKSTIIRLIETITGECNTSHISLMDLSQRFASIGLMGKLLNTCADLETQALEDSSMLKKILGEDALRGEYKGKNAISFKSYAKLIFSTNELPLVKSERTNGFYRRLLVLSMNKTPLQKNVNLFDELLVELPYLLQLSVQAVEEMYKQGAITDSKDSMAAVNQLWRDSDTVQSFLDEECFIMADAKADRTILFNKYAKYCEDAERQAVTRNNFFKALRTKGFSEKRTSTMRYFANLTLKSDTNSDEKVTQDDFITVNQKDLFDSPFY